MTAIAEAPALESTTPPTQRLDVDPEAAPAPEVDSKPRDVLIIDYSGDLEKIWATMILASTSAAMGVKTRVFITFWGMHLLVVWAACYLTWGIGRASCRERV